MASLLLKNRTILSKDKEKASQKPRKPVEKREERTYDFPIPSRDFILQVLVEHGIPLSAKRIAKILELEHEQEIIGLDRRLGAMLRDGQAIKNRKGGFCVISEADLVKGRVIAHPDGFGFLKPENGDDDLFLLPREMRSLWHNDIAVVRVSGIDRRGRQEGAVVEVLERAHQQIVGRIKFDAGVGFLKPDNKRLLHEVLIPSECIGDAKENQMVVVSLIEQPSKHHRAVGEIVEVLGDHMSPGMATDIALRTYDIPSAWPEEVEKEIAGLSKEVPEKSKKGRTDLRDLALVTIDGADARDFDDAVYCKKTAKGWKLLVAIADVSSYVVRGTALDKEAFKRATSVYFPDQVIPMLPEVLSNGLCSLNPDVDRLCMTAELYISEDGAIIRSKFFAGVMRSHARLTYDQVGSMLMDGDAELCEKYADVLPQLTELYALYKALSSHRQKRGAIDFDTTETHFAFDDNGMLDGIKPTYRHDAHRLIEECMLCANVAAARYLLKNKIPAMYRVHERPSPEKTQDLKKFLGQLGLQMGGGDKPTAIDYVNLMEEVKDRPDYRLVQTVLLRSMMQANYSISNVGHFGLAFPAYAHFTSPIRRYPDLMVHRAIRHLLLTDDADSFDYSKPDVQAIAEQCSVNERRADEATRDAADTIKCEFMLDKVGNTYMGTVMSVNSFGLFVELDEVFITGLVHVTSLDQDYFHFDPVAHRLTGEHSGKSYRLSDKIEVKVAAVSLDTRKIDLALANAERPADNLPPKKKRSKKRKRDDKAKKDNG